MKFSNVIGFTQSSINRCEKKPTIIRRDGHADKKLDVIRPNLCPILKQSYSPPVTALNTFMVIPIDIVIQFLDKSI